MIEIPTLECVIHALEDPYAENTAAVTLYEGMALCSSCLNELVHLTEDSMIGSSFASVRGAVRRGRERRNRHG